VNKAGNAPPRVTSARKQEIADLAQIVADEHFPAGRVDPTVIARNKNVTLSYGHYEDAFDGLLEHQSGTFHIYCNLDRLSIQSSPRARFTVAHELGHFFIDEHRAALASGRSPGHGSFTDYESNNMVEQEADHFAANLLMPQVRFIRSATAKTFGMAAVLALADEYGTSVTSTSVRYVSLDLRPSLVVKWSSSGYQWKWLSATTRMANYRKTIEEPSRVVSGSATARALSGESPPGEGFFQCGTTASAWFPFVSSGSWRDVILIEQSVALGRFGVLTLVYPDSGDFLENHN
jgi:Zn-dependent peptidase ImmA (M78 family)